MSELWVYILLPFVSAISCAYLLIKLVARSSNTGFLWLFLNLALVNLIQATGYAVWPYSEVAREYFAHAYLIALYFLCVHLVLFALRLSGESKAHHYYLYAFPLFLTAFHLSGLMVESYRTEGYRILHNDGPLAWCFDLFLLASCFAMVAILWKNMRRHFDDSVIASKNIIALVSLIPLALACGIVILLSVTTYVVSFIVIVPAVSLYSAIVFYYLHRERVVDISVGIGFFIDRARLANRLLELRNTKEERRGYMKAVEKQFIIEALEAHKGNIKESADFLDINHTTLRNKIKEYGIEFDEERIVAIKSRGT